MYNNDNYDYNIIMSYDRGFIDIHMHSNSSSDSDSEDCESVHPVEMMGRQPNSDVFVIGPTLQFTSQGDAIPPEDQTYLWIPYILKKLKVLSSVSPIAALPEVQDPLKSVLGGLKKICGDNFISGMFVLGMWAIIGVLWCKRYGPIFLLIAEAIISLFYEGIQRRCGSVAVCIAYGQVSGGKSNAVKMALALCANLERWYLTYISESSGRKKLGCGLPFAIDDPTKSHDKFKEMLIQAFGGATMENEKGVVVPKCVPLVTANQFIVDALTSDDPRWNCVIVHSKLDSVFIWFYNLH